jgi:UPF0755 protein
MADNNKFWDNFFESENEKASPDDIHEDGVSDDTTVVPPKEEGETYGFKDFSLAEEDPFPMPSNPAPEPPASPSPETGEDSGPEGGEKDTGPEEFDINFDFDGEYRDVPEKRPLRRRREKRSGCIGGLLYGIFIICFSVIAASLLWMAASDVLALGKEEGVVVVTLPDSAFTTETVEVKDENGNVTGTEEQTVADLDAVADILHDEGLIKYKFLFKIFCKVSNAEEKIGPGSYTLNSNYDYRAIVSGTTPGSGQLVEVDVTIPEGYTLQRIFAHLEEEKVCTQAELWDAAANYAFEAEYTFLEGIPAAGDQYRLEGFMFPDTYTFYMGDDPVRVISKFLDNFELKFGETYIQRAAELNYSVRDIITIASMIEREASSYEGERDLIASVIYNRINSYNFPCIQIDATIIYGMERNGDGDKPIDTSYDSPYNTYTHEGLPPGPISNPGEQSIRGALYPESTNYYYYALHTPDENGNVYHEFFSDYNSFLNFLNSSEFGG